MIQNRRSGSVFVLPNDNGHIGKALESPVKGIRSIGKPIHIRPDVSFRREGGYCHTYIFHVLT